MIYPHDFESKIGFEIVRESLISFCESPMGIRAAQDMTFLTDYTAIKHKLTAVSEMMDILQASGEFPLGSLPDVGPWLVEIRAMANYMSGERLRKLDSVLAAAEDTARFFSRRVSSDDEHEESVSAWPVLTSEFSDLPAFRDIREAIERCINRFGEVKDSASPALADIRRQITSASGAMARALRRVLERAASEGIVERDAAPTMRDGRMVIPVSAMSKRRINGIIHDESATGKTVYIEPAEVVEAGNRLRELEMQERREVVAVLMGVADIIRPSIDELLSLNERLGRLDFIRAKGRLAIDTNAQMPVLEENPELDWFHAVHPGLLMTLRAQNREVVPLNICLRGERRILIISGPNAGGKSVCLKTVAIVQYMMQCGLMPTLYSNSHMAVFDNIFIDIGDEQSIENDLSTYSSHLRNMKYFLSNADSRSLLLADEMGSGTEPQIGGALAQAILKRLGESGCFGVITTHYQNLKTFADSEPGFVNGAMLYDREHLQPTFQLSVGTPGSSFALEIARKTGLPGDVITLAKEIVGSDYVNMDKYLLDIARDRRYWANKRKSIKEKENHLDSLLENYEDSARSLKEQRAAILRQAREDAKEIMSGANAAVERAVHEIKKADADKEVTRRMRQELTDLRHSLDDNDEKTPELLKPLRHQSRKSRQAKTEPVTVEKKPAFTEGDYVKMQGGGVPGRIMSIQGKKAEVAFGGLRTIVALDKLTRVAKPQQSANVQISSLSNQTVEQSRERQLKFRNEIDVRGMRADEALQAVTYFIDDAIQFNASRVRILHGTGHGILKQVIRQWLKANPAVVSAEDEDVRFGGAGITVVDLS
ncbi:MAG: Smr/MutS family protein [Muribaculaceae bacterium]|nr:Smr/MutS family protein [Muribaculaceae bacterium]